MICSEDEMDERQAGVRLGRCKSCGSSTVYDGLCGECLPRKRPKPRCNLTERCGRYRVLLYVLKHGPSRVRSVAMALSMSENQVREDLCLSVKVSDIMSSDGIQLKVSRIERGLYQVERVW